MEDIKKLLQEEFEKYQNGLGTYKPYMQSMKDISAWLKEKEK